MTLGMISVAVWMAVAGPAEASPVRQGAKLADEFARAAGNPAVRSQTAREAARRSVRAQARLNRIDIASRPVTKPATAAQTSGLPKQAWKPSRLRGIYARAARPVATTVAPSAVRAAQRALAASRGPILSARKASSTAITTSEAQIKAQGAGGHWLTYNKQATEGPYSHIVDRTKIEAGRDYTQAQKARIREANRQMNGGVLRDDETGKRLIEAKQHQRGKTPPTQEAHVDHQQAKSKGGANSYDNARLRSREANLQKGDR